MDSPLPKMVNFLSGQLKLTSGVSQTSWNMSGRTITSRIGEAARPVSVARLALEKGVPDSRIAP